MNTVGIILGLIGIGAIIFFSRKKDTAPLEKARAEDQVKLDALKTEETKIPEEVAKKQAAATEEEKNEFWKNHLNPTDNK